MGWVWNDDDAAGAAASLSSDDSLTGGEIWKSSSGDRCSTRKVVRSQCRTEEVEPGKFVRKCEKTEEVFKDCLGRPAEVVQSNKEYTEEDVSNQVTKGSFTLDSPDLAPFGFPGLRSDMEAIERSFLGGMSHFFEAAEEMKNGFLNAFGTPRLYNDESSSLSRGSGIPIKGNPPQDVCPKPKKSDGDVDLSGLAREV